MPRLMVAGQHALPLYRTLSPVPEASLVITSGMIMRAFENRGPGLTVQGPFPPPANGHSGGPGPGQGYPFGVFSHVGLIGQKYLFFSKVKPT